jgi:hypothetical protein
MAYDVPVTKGRVDDIAHYLASRRFDACFSFFLIVSIRQKCHAYSFCVGKYWPKNFPA